MTHKHRNSQAEKTAIIVAGMHRSGTSATTRIVNLLGADLAHELIPAAIGNERGHWESRAVQDLHNRMLEQLGADIYSPVDFPGEWFGSAEALPWIGRIGDLLAEDYCNSRFFVIKDPRIALFLPLWTEAMRQNSISPKFVIPFRHPDAVATSLEMRERKLNSGNDLPHAQGVAVWLRYVLAAEKSTRGQPRSFIAFDNLLADWHTEFKRIGRQLGIDWPNGMQLDAEIDGFLDTGCSGHETRGPPNEMSEICHGIYTSLQQAIREPDSNAPVFDAARQVLATAGGLLGPSIVAREHAFADLKYRSDIAAQQHDFERAEMHARFAIEIGLRDTRIAEAASHARQLQESIETLEQERRNAFDYAKSLEEDRDRARENNAKLEDERVDMHARFASEIELRDTRIAEAAAHAEMLEREHRNASDYAISLVQDRDRAVDYALSLKESRDQALEYAQALEQARSEESAKTRAEVLAHNGMPIFFTIASRNYLAYAMTLMQSVATHYPDAPRYLILADRDGGDDALIDAPFITICAEELALPDFEAFAFRYNIMEFNTAIKPYAFAHLRGRHPESGIIYLDPDILVVEPLIKVETALAEGALAVLTPHLLEPVEDDLKPGEREILASGTYNCGFVAIGSHADADRLVAWWANRLEFGALSDIAAGLFTDQKWVDLVPGLFADVFILRDEGYNLAYWNVSQRAVSMRGKHWRAGNQQLAFVHFSGINFDQPAQFSKHQNRHTRESIGKLKVLYADYLDLLAANGHAEHRTKPYAFGSFADGEVICDPVRAVYRRYFDKGAAQPQSDPFSMDRRLYDAPCDELPERIDAPMTRLMYAVWKMRSDLQHAFDVTHADGRRGFIRWFVRAAQLEMAIPERHLDAARRSLTTGTTIEVPHFTLEQVSSESTPLHRAASFCLDAINWSCRYRLALHIYAAVPESTRNRVRRRLEQLAGRSDAAAQVSNQQAPGGVNLVGYAHGEFGVAEVLRRYAHALQGGGVPFIVRNFDTGVASRQGDRSMERLLSNECRYDVNVFCINADQMPVAREQLGDAVFAGRYNIGCWFWELETFPEQWDSSIDMVDEIWVTSAFVRDAIAARTTKPVHIVPVALEVNHAGRGSRRDLGLAEGVFLCLFSFDFNSFVTRKNADGVIAAFQRAFGDGRRDVHLLVKTINGDRFPDALRRLIDLAEGDDRIEVRDGFLDRQGMWALQACCDCYVSLHRSEGLGLGMAECMLLGKPVVATAYSGNLAFMNADNSCLVGYSLIPVREGEYPAWQGQSWAEPDINQAAAYLARLADDPVYARGIGENAKASVSKQLSRTSSLAAMTARLRAIRSRQ